MATKVPYDLSSVQVGDLVEVFDYRGLCIFGNDDDADDCGIDPYTIYVPRITRNLIGLKFEVVDIYPQNGYTLVRISIPGRLLEIDAPRTEWWLSGYEVRPCYEDDESFDTDGFENLI